MNTTTENQTDGNELSDTANMPCKRIGSFVIGGRKWLTICDMGSDGLGMLIGNASVDKQMDMTWLSSWKVRSPAPERFKTIEDFEAELSELPLWDGTRWASKSDDFLQEWLIDCRTGEVDSESNEAKAQIKRLRDSKIAMN